MTLRPRTALAVALAAVLLAGGCGDTGEEEPTMDERASLETAIEGYAEMRASMIAGLDAEFGEVRWGESSSSRGLRHGTCEGVVEGAPPGTDTAFLPRYMREGAYDDQAAALAVIDRVGREYGFGPLELEADNGTTSVHAARDDLGAVYDVTLARNTVIGIQTGCHEWAERPSAPLPTEPQIPDDGPQTIG